MVRYSEGPAVQVEAHVSAPPVVVWPLADLDLQVPVAVEFTEDVDEAVARHAAGYAFTIGAMGSGTKTFYNDAFARQGFGEEVRAVQRLWRDGRRDEAARLVPHAIGQKTNLLGTPAMIRERIRLYRRAGVSTLALKLGGPLNTRLAALAQLIELTGEVNREPAPRPPPRPALREPRSRPAPEPRSRPALREDALKPP